MSELEEIVLRVFVKTIGPSKLGTFAHFFYLNLSIFFELVYEL